MQLRFRIHAAPSTVAHVAETLHAAGICSDLFAGTEHVYCNIATEPEQGEPCAFVRRTVSLLLGWNPLRVQALLAPGGYWADAVPEPKAGKADSASALSGRAGA